VAVVPVTIIRYRPEGTVASTETLIEEAADAPAAGATAVGLKDTAMPV